MADSLSDLILARLVVGKTKPALKKLHADLAPLFGKGLTLEQVQARVDELRAAGLMPAKGQSLTGEGRARALAYLGATELPPRANWGTIRNNYLVPRALGLTPGSAESLARTNPAPKLAARIVKFRAGLPTGTGDGLIAVFEALVCRELGFPEQTSLAAVREAVVYGKLTELTGASGHDKAALVAIVFAGAFEAAPEEVAPAVKPAAKAMSLGEFASAIDAAARRESVLRYGKDEVFISHVWKALKDAPEFAPLGLTGFKSRLAEASRAGLVHLSRADLVHVMNPTDVRESELSYLNSDFHFILLKGN